MKKPGVRFQNGAAFLCEQTNHAPGSGTGNALFPPTFQHARFISVRSVWSPIRFRQFLRHPGDVVRRRRRVIRNGGVFGRVGNGFPGFPWRRYNVNRFSIQKGGRRNGRIRRTPLRRFRGNVPERRWGLAFGFLRVAPSFPVHLKHVSRFFPHFCFVGGEARRGDFAIRFFTFRRRLRLFAPPFLLCDATIVRLFQTGIPDGAPKRFRRRFQVHAGRCRLCIGAESPPHSRPRRLPVQTACRHHRAFPARLIGSSVVSSCGRKPQLFPSGYDNLSERVCKPIHRRKSFGTRTVPFMSGSGRSAFFVSFHFRSVNSITAEEALRCLSFVHFPFFNLRRL